MSTSTKEPLARTSRSVTRSEASGRSKEAERHAETKGDVTSRSLTGIGAIIWARLTGQRLKKGRVRVVEKDIRSAHAAATVAALRPDDGLAAALATRERDRLGFRPEELDRGWKNVAALLDTIIEGFDDEDHARDSEEADRNEYGDQL